MGEVTSSAPKSCFIAMPVSTSSEDAERFGDDEHWAHVLQTIFVPAVKAAGFLPILPTAQGSDLIHSRIVRHLQDADMVLCDLSSHNPNVFFELGVRTATNLPIALVCDQHSALPFDTGGINTHRYDASLDGWKIQSQVDVLAEHLRSSELACEGENPLWRAFGLTITATEPTEPASREEAQLELMAQELSQIRSMLKSTQPSRSRDARSKHEFVPLTDDATTPTALRLFVREASNMSTEEGLPLRWFRATDDDGVAFIPSVDYDEMHIASRRALEDVASNRRIDIVTMPALDKPT